MGKHSWDVHNTWGTVQFYRHVSRRLFIFGTIHIDGAFVTVEFIRGQYNLLPHHNVGKNVHLVLVSSNFHRKPTFSIHGLGCYVCSGYKSCVDIYMFCCLDYAGSLCLDTDRVIPRVWGDLST